MTFTYTSNLNTDDIDYIRFHTGDTTESEGIKPNGANFSDEELTALLSIEGTKYRAVAAVFEALSATWAIYVNTQMGSRREGLEKVADNFMKLASQWRKQHGETPSATTLTTGFVTRVDGYSNDIDSGEQ